MLDIPNLNETPDTQVPESKNEFFPVGSFIMITPALAAEVSSGGIFIPEQARASLNQGTIVRMGPDVPRCLPGDPTGYKIGDVIMFVAHSEYKVALDGTEYKLVDASNVILRQTRL
jgi:co-chaperonin GroES (HSP10)